MEKFYTKKTFTSSLALSIFVNVIFFALGIKLLSGFYKPIKKPIEVVLLGISQPKTDDKILHVKNKTLAQKKQNILITQESIPKEKINNKVFPKQEIQKTGNLKTADKTDKIEKTNNAIVHTDTISNNESNTKSSKGSAVQTTQNIQTTQTTNSFQSVSKEDYAFLRKLIEEHLKYPYLARRNSYEGTVVISFIIDNGIIKDIEIVKSSGYSILDKSAIEAIKKIEPLVKLDKNVKIVIPINFKLNNS
ncbi:outer membrane transport energization protein TonB [Desulfurella multipotens]|uniref:Outer membrane transport energization protein TonB n=1 Tax=Desulfurella multipotens TaxID=79269 RepID=A0A1G6QNL0_9BACT|nr:energy transducer TonB [Desulfurella multipotens]SDC93247.1 outer membrane transport energization protein TonB [Desulfurella multipotens]